MRYKLEFLFHPSVTGQWIIIIKEQQKDDFSKKINKKYGFVYHNQILFNSKKDTLRIVLPQKLIKSVLEYFHDKNGHYGTGRRKLDF